MTKGLTACACAVVTITGLKLSLPWLDAGEQGCSGAGIIPVSPCPFGLSKFQEVRPAWSSLQLPKSISHCVRWTVALSDVLKRGLFRSSPNQVACTSKPTGSFLVLHTWNAAGELERNRLSHLASPWILILLPLTCTSTTWKLPSKAKRANRLRQPPGWIYNNTEPPPPTSIKQKERSRNREKAQIFYHKQDWSAQPLDSWKLSKVIQCQTFSIRTGIYPTHPLPNVVRIFRKVR